MPRTNARPFIERQFPELLRHPITSSKMYEHSINPVNNDCWWFKFNTSILDENDFIVLAGAKDYMNEDFKIFKVPSAYFKTNRDRIYVSEKDWLIVYIHLVSHHDVRSSFGLRFGQFAIN
jgi:hypothetical protein